MKLKDFQIREILKEYKIGSLKSKNLIYNKWNTSYLIKTTRGNFLLKVLNFQSKKELLNEIEITKRIKEIPLSFPLLSNSKNFYIKYDQRIILIKKFVQGKPVLRGENLSNKNLSKLGRYFAIIHKTKNISKIPKKDLYKNLKKFFNKLDRSSKEFKLADYSFNLLNKRKFIPQNLPKGLIHADLHTENLLVNNNKIVAILDFEDAHIGPFIYDLGICILDTCWKNQRLSKDRINIFIRGYEEIRKLTTDEKNHLINSAIFAGLYYLHFSIIKNGLNNKNLNYYIVKRFSKILRQKS